MYQISLCGPDIQNHIPKRKEHYKICSDLILLSRLPTFSYIFCVVNVIVAVVVVLFIVYFTLFVIVHH